MQLSLRHRSKGLTLTSAGAELVADARALLAHADELHTAARSLGTELAGKLVVGCFSTLGPFVMPQLLEGFQLRHPGVQVQFIEGSQRPPELAVERSVRAGSVVRRRGDAWD